MLSRRVRRKLRDPDEEPDPFEASEFGEVIAVDHIHAFRSPDDSDALDKSYVVLCVRENFGKDRSSRAVLRALTKFVGSRPSFLTLPKSSKKQLPRRWVEFSSSSIPNQCPQDAQSAREISTFQEGVACRLPSVLSCGLLHIATGCVPWWRLLQQIGFCHWGCHVNRLLLGQLVFYRH